MRHRLVIVTLLVTVVSLVGGSVAFASPGPLIYRGRTSQGLKIQFFLGRNNHGALLMNGLEMGVNLPCPDGSVLQFGLGTFTSPGEPLTGHDMTFDQVDESTAIHAAGTFTHTAASGTLKMNVADLNVNEQAQLCSTGDLTWTAHRSAKKLARFAGYATRGPVHVHRFAGGVVARYARRA